MIGSRQGVCAVDVLVFWHLHTAMIVGVLKKSGHKRRRLFFFLTTQIFHTP